jgi:hypothetical protein
MNLNQKLLALKKAVPYLQKADRAYDYDYVSEDDVLGVVNARMIELGLLLVPSIDKSTLRQSKHEYVTAKGKNATDIVVTADMTYTWIDVETGERLEVSWIMAGQQDDASQAIGSGITYCGRYFLLKFLQIPTGKDDPDKWRADRKRLLEKTGDKPAATPGKPDPAVDAKEPEKSGSASTQPPQSGARPVGEWSDKEVLDYPIAVSNGKPVTVREVIEKSPTPEGAAAWFEKVAKSAKRSALEKSVAARAIVLLTPLPWSEEDRKREG